MARIAEGTLEAIRQRVDIAELVREFVPDLKRAGRNFKARCPFHNEKTPSFHVNSERQIFHCFGCQAGGDIFKFLMTMESLGFVEAVEKLGARAGVQVAPATEEMSARDREFLRMREALAFAQEFYAQVLARSPEADVARRYLDKRKLGADARTAFGIGHSLADGASLLQAAVKKGFAPDLLAKAGLVSLVEGRGQYRDFFRGRVLFPIRGTKGDVIGFGGRVLGDGLPKYINSPDTPVFTKGRVLYGLFEGLQETRKARKVILLEGYTDVIAMHQYGFKNSCAPLGTAVTPDHLDLLKRYAEEAFLVFDPDDAGAAASLRGAQLLLERGFTVRIATIPDELDADEFLQRDGAEAFQKVLDAAIDLPDYQTNAALAKVKGALKAEEKDRIAHDVLATIAKAESDILKGEWLRRLAQRLGADESDLRTKMSKTARGVPEPRPGSRLAPKALPPKPGANLASAEREMLLALFMQPELVKDGELLRADDFENDAARAIYLKLSELLGAQDGAVPAGWSASLVESLEAEARALAGQLLVEHREGDARETIARMVRGERLLRRYRVLEVRMKEMLERQSSDPGIAQEYGLVKKELSDLRLLDRTRETGRNGLVGRA
ncbi:MAG: DNA primase [Elusimicrobia bacterium]|nr:DNA primase [Elusimicrobiota bacterium]